MSVICSLKHFGWCNQADTKPTTIYAVFRRCICLYTTRFQAYRQPTHVTWLELNQA